MKMPSEIWLIRHGETAWSLSGQHTSRTDLSLTSEGVRRAMQLRDILAGRAFAPVLSSPMKRAMATGQMAGYFPEAYDDLREWDYGDYEGLTSAEIQKTAPGWTIWTGAVPGGESIAQVSARADRVIERASNSNHDVALFGHGHMLRVLAARWIGMDASAGQRLALSTGSISVLGFEHATRVIRLWNQTDLIQAP
jgi:probable phosphoglycerate mutase